MIIMDPTDRAIMNALNVNMGYVHGESVGIVMHQWHPDMGEASKDSFVGPGAVCQRMFEVYEKAGIPVDLLTTVPTATRHGADAAPDLYEASAHDILFMPTAFSLTHTDYRKEQTAKGTRVASMPTFNLGMFEEGGPMSADYVRIERETRETAEKLRTSQYVRVQALGTDMIVQVDPSLVHESSGILRERGAWGNLPGAEAYVVPMHLGNSHGYFTVPKGWGGPNPLPFAVTFYVEDGRFVEAKPRDRPFSSPEERNALIQNMFDKPENSVLAELGIGLNYLVDPEYIAKKGWSALLAEKIGGSAHFANGNSAGMGGQNKATVHQDWVVPDVCIHFNYHLG